MKNHTSIKELVRELQQIDLSDRSRAESLIEKLLEQSLNGLSPDEKITILEKLIVKFKPVSKPSYIENLEEDVYKKLFSLFLEKGIEHTEDLTPVEFLEKLGKTLDVIFNRLNDLVANIEEHFYGKNIEQKVTWSDLKGNDFEKCFDRIYKAFMTTLQSHEISVRNIVKEILDELDPNSIDGGSGFKISTFKNAEKFRQYEQKFSRCQRYFESEKKFKDRLRKEFQENCHRVLLNNLMKKGV